MRRLAPVTSPDKGVQPSRPWNSAGGDGTTLRRTRIVGNIRAGVTNLFTDRGINRDGRTDLVPSLLQNRFIPLKCRKYVNIVLYIGFLRLSSYYFFYFIKRTNMQQYGH